MFKGLRGKYGRLTDGQQTAVISLIWLGALEFVFFTWVISGGSIFRVLSIIMMIVTGIANVLASVILFLEERDEQKNVENLEE